MKKTILLSTIFLISMTINAQNWVDKFQDVNENFYSIQSEFNAYWRLLKSQFTLPTVMVL